MTNVMSGRFVDAMVTTSGACMVVVLIAAIDERVRMYLARVLTSDPSSELVQASVYAQRFARFVMESATAHGSEPFDARAPRSRVVVIGVTYVPHSKNRAGFPRPPPAHFPLLRKSEPL